MKKGKNFFVSISLQISIFLVIVAFIPVAIMMALKTYEKQQLNMMENSNVQQGRLVAAAIISENNEKIDGKYANLILCNMKGKFDARIRILDKNGFLIADSSQIEKIDEINEVDEINKNILNGKKNENLNENLIERNLEEGMFVDGEKTFEIENDDKIRKNEKNEKKSVLSNENFIYRMLSFPVRVYRKILKSPRRHPYENADFYSNKEIFDGEEINKALNGEYGAATRFSSGGQVSVTLYSAIPIGIDNVIGVVLVSKSTYKILQNVYELRLELGKIFLRSLFVVLIIALFLAFRISYPLKKLSRQAAECADKKGRIFYTDFTGKKRHDEIGELSRAFSSLIERLNKRIKFSQAFSADISHEFKNPLTAIRTSAEILGGEKLSDSERFELSNAVVDEVSHLQNLLNGVKNISKIDAGDVIENQKKIAADGKAKKNAKKSIENSMSYVKNFALDSVMEGGFIPANIFTKNIISRLEKNYPDVVVEFKSSENEIDIPVPQDYYDRVCENLIDNAMSFGSKVYVSTTIVKDKDVKNSGKNSVRNSGYNHFYLCVEDNGKGIEKNQTGKIFERFYSERSDENKINHTGLGLSIVKAIADTLEGEIAVEKSENLGGAKFIFKFSF